MQLGRSAASYRHFVMQKMLIERNFPCFDCSFDRRKLRCLGEITPAEGCDHYRIRIDYTPGGIPKVRILKPHIEPKEAIHMYKDGRLCLYYPPDTPWQNNDNIHQKIIPWTAEWLVYYELFLLHGKWLGPEIPHEDFPSQGSAR